MSFAGEIISLKSVTALTGTFTVFSLVKPSKYDLEILCFCREGNVKIALVDKEQSNAEQCIKKLTSVQISLHQKPNEMWTQNF